LGRIKDTRSLSHFKANVVGFHDITNKAMYHSKNHTRSFTAGTEKLIDLEDRVSDFSFYHCAPFNIELT